MDPSFNDSDGNSDSHYAVQPYFSQVSVSDTSQLPSTPSTPTLLTKVDKQFNDPVHGFIHLELLLVKVIDTPYFQRLRNLKQLGAGYYVFPGASHNRFEHSIGTAHLAGVMAERLRQVDSQRTLNLTDRIILLIKLAGLLHDLGHGPFSHVFDGLFIPQMVKRCSGIIEDTKKKQKQNDNNVELQKIIEKNTKLFNHLNNWTHEDASEMMLEEAIKSAGLCDDKQYTDPLSEDEILFVKQLINPKRYETHVFPEYEFYYDIISNSRCSIDVDKFDYIQRDCLNSGVTCAADFKRLLQRCKVIDNQVCFDKNVSWNVVELFHTRYTLFKQIYSHRKIKCVEYMIADALCEADEALHIAERVLDAESYLNLDDSIIHEIEFYRLPKDSPLTSAELGIQKAQNILRRLRYRQLYRYCAETLLPPNHNVKGIEKITEKYVAKFLPKNSLLDENTIIVQKFSLNYANKDNNPIDNVRFFNSHQPDRSFGIPSNKVSLLIPRFFSEKYIRIFIRLDNRQEQSNAASALKGALEKVLGPSHHTGNDFDNIDAAVPIIDEGHVVSYDRNSLLKTPNNCGIVTTSLPDPSHHTGNDFDNIDAAVPGHVVSDASNCLLKTPYNFSTFTTSLPTFSPDLINPTTQQPSSDKQTLSVLHSTRINQSTPKYQPDSQSPRHGTKRARHNYNNDKSSTYPSSKSSKLNTVSSFNLESDNDE